LCFGSLAIPFLERFLVEHPPPGLVLAGGIPVLLLVLAGVVLVLHLGAVGDEVVGVSAVKLISPPCVHHDGSSYGCCGTA
jgi:hypothetical protein